MRGEPDYLHEDWLTKSVPIQMEQILIGHPIRDQTSLVSFYNLLDNFNVGFTLTATYLFSIFTILVLALLLNELTHWIQTGAIRTNKISKRIASVVGSFRTKQLSALGLFLLFVHLFLWIIQLFLTNNIKTNKVVVNTDDLIKDKNDVLNTRKLACILKDDQLHSMIVSSPTKNILGRIYEKTKLRPDMVNERAILEGDRCLSGREPKMASLITSDIFLVFIWIRYEIPH